MAELPEWAHRALRPNSPITKGGESVRTASSEVDGRHFLYPTLRLEDGKLRRYNHVGPYNEALMLAIDKGDYIEFDTEEEATAWSKKFSDRLGGRKSLMSILSKTHPAQPMSTAVHGSN